MFSPLFFAAMIVSLLSAAKAAAVTKEEVIAAQKAWGDGIVEISEAHQRSAASARTRAEKLLDDLYAFGQGNVLLKPRLAGERASRPTEKHAFRLAREGALSYLVGGDGAYPEDRGFATETPWKTVRFEIEGLVLANQTALALGSCYYTNAAGATTKEEYSFGYIRDQANPSVLRINLHHTSIPFVIEETSWLGWLVYLLLVCAALLGAAIAVAMARVRTSNRISIVARFIMAVHSMQRWIQRQLGLKKNKVVGGMLPLNGKGGV